MPDDKDGQIGGPIICTVMRQNLCARRAGIFHRQVSVEHLALSAVGTAAAEPAQHGRLHRAFIKGRRHLHRLRFDHQMALLAAKEKGPGSLGPGSREGLANFFRRICDGNLNGPRFTTVSKGKGPLA